MFRQVTAHFMVCVICPYTYMERWRQRERERRECVYADGCKCILHRCTYLKADQEIKTERERERESERERGIHTQVR